MKNLFCLEVYIDTKDAFLALYCSVVVDDTDHTQGRRPNDLYSAVPKHVLHLCNGARDIILRIVAQTSSPSTKARWKRAQRDLEN